MQTDNAKATGGYFDECIFYANHKLYVNSFGFLDFFDLYFTPCFKICTQSNTITPLRTSQIRLLPIHVYFFKMHHTAVNPVTDAIEQKIRAIRSQEASFAKIVNEISYCKRIV